ncbi:hypothetical protein Tco_0641236, partial [Tanacetum coccineum]
SHSARVTKVMALSDSAFYTDSEGDELGNEDIKEDEEDESLDADDKGKRSDDKGHGSDDEGHGLSDEEQRLDEKGRGLEGEGLGLEEEEEAALEGQQQEVLVIDTAASEPLGLGYGAARRRALESIEEIAPSTYEVGQSSRSMPEQQGADRLELHGSILHDHTRRLDALPPTLVADIDRDVIELYTSSGLVRDEIFLQRHGVRHVNTWMADMSWAGNDDHRLIYDMLVQQAALQRELQETRDCVIALEQERGRRKE